MRCSVCGTDNDFDAVYCKECGAKLSDHKKETSRHQNKKKTKVGSKRSPAQSGKPVKKTIDPVKLTYTIVLLVIIGGAILYSSGVFDQTSVPAVSEGQVDEFHRGADLSKLQEINQLREQVTNNPEDHESMLHLAHLLNDSGFKEESIKWYKQYLKVHGDVADVWVDMGVCYFDMNDFDNAISSMKKGIELNPEHQIAHFNLGIVNYSKGNLKEAVDWWNKAIELNPATDIANRARELIKNNTNM